MKWMIAGMAITLLMMSVVSHAEEKLFITDILEKGEMEVEAFFSYSHFSGDVSYESPAFSADTEIDEASSLYVLHLGLGHDFELEATIPYVFSRRIKTRSRTVPTLTTRDREEGFGDISLGGQYKVFSDTDKAFELVGGLGVKLETAPEDDDGTGTTDIISFVAASATLAESIRPFAGYRFRTRNHGGSDTHSVFIGAEKELNDNAGLQVSAGADFYTSSDFLGSYEGYYFAVESYIHIYRDFYVIPGIEFVIFPSSDFKDPNGRFDSSSAIDLTLGFYYLF